MRSLTDRQLRGLAVAGFCASVGLNVAYLALGQGLEDQDGLAYRWRTELPEAAGSVLTTGVGLVLAWARPRNPVGWLLGLAGLLLSLQHAGAAYAAYAWVLPDAGLPAGRLVLAVLAPLWIPAVFIPVTFVLVRYPTGRIDGRWARRFDRAVLVGMVALCVVYSLSPEAVTDDLEGATNPFADLLPTPVKATIILTALGLALAGLAGILGDAVRRIVRSPRAERIALLWLLTWSVLATVIIFYGPSEDLGSWAYTGVLVAIAVGVLRYQALGIEVAVQRTLVYGTLTGLVVAVFIGLVAGLAQLVPSGPTPQIVAAAVIAVGLAPARERVQRGVNRLLYGARSDPSRALRRLGSSAEGTTPAELASALVTTLAEDLHVSGVTVRDPAGEPLASAGRITGDPVAVPLVVGARDLGVLEVGPRSGERALGRRDRALLDSIAPFVASALHSAALAEDLRASRNRVVEVTATERDRLRRDLHDGLGPALTGIGLGLEAAQRRPDPALVARLRVEVAAALEETRRIIDDLRPVALDGRDLLTLLRERGERVQVATGIEVSLQVPDSLPELPPDVEVAAYRILDEALTNVVRHSQATHCSVRVDALDRLRLEVDDDGVGHEALDDHRVGVGLLSMRERAERLGGCFDVAPRRPGTRVVAELPLPADGSGGSR